VNSFPDATPEHIELVRGKKQIIKVPQQDRENVLGIEVQINQWKNLL